MGLRGSGVPGSHWPSRAVATLLGLRRCPSVCPAVFVSPRFLSDDRSLEYKYYKLRLAEAGRQGQATAGVDGKPPVAACAVRAMLYARAVRGLKKRLLPGRRRRRLLHAQGLWGRKARRMTTGTQTLLSSGTRLKHHGQQGPGALQRKVPLLDKSDAANACPDLAAPSLHPSPEATAGPASCDAPQPSSPSPADGESTACELASWGTRRSPFPLGRW